MANATEEPMEPSRPRHRLRLSVRALMAVVLVLAVVLGWVVHRANVQRDAVAAIVRTGGSIRYEWQRVPGVGWDLKDGPGWRKWLVERLGVDYFGNVVIAKLGKQVTDAEMAYVARLARLESISIANGENLTDAGMVHLRGLVDLEVLNFHGTKVSGACLANLRRLTKLKSLMLDGVPLSDADLVHLGSLTNLDSLDLRSAPVTDAGLAHLAGLVNLRLLRLSKTAVTDLGITRLQKANPSLKFVQVRVIPTRTRAASTTPPRSQGAPP